MYQIHIWLSSLILKVVDAFYPLFKRWMPKQTYRYAACGGFNTSLDIFLFFISYNFLFKKQAIELPMITISAHISAFIVAFLVTFPLGFYMSRYVVWQETAARKREQLAKYILVVAVCVLMNYVLLKLFVDMLGWYPTPSKILTTFFVVAFSYYSQKHYTFKAA